MSSVCVAIVTRLSAFWNRATLNFSASSSTMLVVGAHGGAHVTSAKSIAMSLVIVGGCPGIPKNAIASALLAIVLLLFSVVVG